MCLLCWLFFKDRPTDQLPDSRLSYFHSVELEKKVHLIDSIALKNLPTCLRSRNVVPLLTTGRLNLVFFHSHSLFQAMEIAFCAPLPEACGGMKNSGWGSELHSPMNSQHMLLSIKASAPTLVPTRRPSRPQRSAVRLTAPLKNVWRPDFPQSQFAQLGEMHIFALANFLGRPIILYSSDDDTAAFGTNVSATFLPWRRRPSECFGVPLALAWQVGSIHRVRYRLPK